MRKSEEFVSTGERSQRFGLTSTSIAQGSVSVRTDDSVWEEARFFIDSGLDSWHFQVETDGLDVTWILFGDGIHGAIPPAGEAVTVEYLETLGAEGNIGRALVTELVSPIYHNGTRIDLAATNPIASTGGSEREALDHAKLQAPAELRSLWKAVTKDDYKALVEGLPGVAKAQVLDANDCANIRYYQVNMAVAPAGGGLPSPTLKREIADFIESRKVITVEVSICDPSYRPVVIDAEVYVYPTEQTEDVRMRVESALREFFAFEKMSFGQTVHFSDVVALLDGIRGVSHVRLYSPAADVEIRPGEIATLGEVHLDVRRAT